MLSIRKPVLVLAVLVLSTASAGQTIFVTVDGATVAFRGVGPQMSSGRVLVPLRGVLEQMGAVVDWDPATRRVMAQKGDRTVILPVGFRTATVNGQPVQLDVPATIMMGTTMVPLRFLSEALGAEVKWNSGARTVEIATTTAGAPVGPAPPQPGVQPKITSFTHNATGWLTAGSVLEVTLKGTPAAAAVFSIPGVVDRVGMAEESPGVYKGSWTVPAGTADASAASVIGTLTIGANERLIQAGNLVKIDTTSPLIRSQTPDVDSQIAQSKPGISAVFDDGAGSGISTVGAKIKVNDNDVTRDSTVTASFITYKPADPLPSGANKVEVSVRDTAGNSAEAAWAFTVTTQQDVIKSFTHDAQSTMQPGDVITIRLEGAPGGSAAFGFSLASGQKTRTWPMPETASGVYVGEYTLRRDDDLRGAKVFGSLTTRGGETYNVEADAVIGGAPAELAAPVITQPVEGAKVVSPLVITGTAASNARVRINVTYATTVLGAIRLDGNLADQVVDTDDAGAFASSEIQLGTIVKGKNTTYTLTAVTVGASGQESQPTVVNCR